VLVREPRARRTLLEGGEGTSSEADPTRGRRGPSSEVDPARGGREPSSEADLTRGGREPSSEADLTRGGRFAGPLWWAAGAAAAWIMLRVRFALGSRWALCFAFFSGFKQDPPRFFRGPSWLSPTKGICGNHASSRTLVSKAFR
jgi:hypothetical protein